jgi:hypothetical protein
VSSTRQSLECHVLRRHPGPVLLLASRIRNFLSSLGAMRIRQILTEPVFVPVIIILVINLLLSIGVLVYNVGPIILRQTTNLLPFSPAQVGWDATISSWLPNSFGFSSPGYNMGVFFLFLIQSVFNSPWTSQWALIFSPFWLSSLTMFFLLWKGGITRSSLVLVCGTLVYEFNWFTIQYMGTNLLIYAYSALPLAILGALRISTGKGSWYSNAALLSVSLFIATMFYTVAGASYISAFFLSGLICWLLIATKTPRKVVRDLVTVLAGFLLYVMETLGFTLPSLLSLLGLGVRGYASSSKFVVIVNNFIAYLNPNYYVAYFPSLLTPVLILASDSSGILFIGSLFIALTAVLPLMSTRSEIRIISIGLWVSFLLSLLMVILIQTRSPLVQIIYSSLPILWPINSADVYLMIFAGAIAICFPLGLETLRSIVRTNSSALGGKKLETAFLVSIVALSGLGTGSSMLGHNQEFLNPSSFTNGQNGTSLPTSIANLTSWFNSERQVNGPFRVLWVPQSNRMNELTQSLDVYSDFAPSALSPGLHQQIETLANSMAAGEKTGVSQQLLLLGFGYIVVLKNFSGSGPISISSGGIDTYLTGSPENFERFLNSSRSDFSLVANNALFSLYAIKNIPANWHGMLWSTNNSALVGASSTNLVVSNTIGNGPQWEKWLTLSNSSFAQSSRIEASPDQSSAVNGTISLKLAVTAGSDGKIDSGVYRWFSSPPIQNSSFIDLYAYGTGLGGQFKIVLSSDQVPNSYTNIAGWNIPDNFVGWKSFSLPLRNPSEVYGNWILSSTVGVLIKYTGSGFNAMQTMDIRIGEVAFATTHEIPLVFSPVKINEMSPLFAPTKVVVEVQSPSILVFGQNYDVAWSAYGIGKNGTIEPLVHEEVMGWANGFKVSGTGMTTVTITYRLQSPRFLLLLAWAAAAVILPIVVFILWRKNPRWLGQSQKSKSHDS